MPLNTITWETEIGESLRLRLDWATELVSGCLRLRRETLFYQKANSKKTKKHIGGNIRKASCSKIGR